MPIIRYALVDTSLKPKRVVDIAEINDDPGLDDHETLVVTDPFHAVQSDDAEIGWTWINKKLKPSEE